MREVAVVSKSTQLRIVYFCLISGGLSKFSCARAGFGHMTSCMGSMGWFVCSPGGAASRSVIDEWSK